LDGVPNTLGLDDDLDGVELVRSVESAFDVRIPNSDAARMRTVGDLYDWLLDNLQAYSDGRKCASAMTFYRLRIAFGRLGVDSRMLPSTRLKFLEKGNLKQFFLGLAKETGLRVPLASPGKLTLAVCSALVILASAGLTEFAFLSSHGIPILAILVVIALAGWWVLARDKGRLPTRLSTFGELAKRMAVMNYGRLIKMGAKHTPDRVWDVLLDLLAGYALPKSQIGRETVFLKSQLKNPTAA
jgi:hypothetical protein